MKALAYSLCLVCCVLLVPLTIYSQPTFISEWSDLTGTLPTGWSTHHTQGARSGIVNGQLVAHVTNGGAQIERKGITPKNATSFEIQWHACMKYTQWGGRNYATINIGDSLYEFKHEYNKPTFGDLNLITIKLNGRTIFSKNTAATFETFVYTVECSENQISFNVSKYGEDDDDEPNYTYSTGENCFIQPKKYQKNYSVPKISCVQWNVQTTTNTDLWLDNPQIRVGLEDAFFEDDEPKYIEGTVSVPYGPASLISYTIPGSGCRINLPYKADTNVRYVTKLGTNFIARSEVDYAGNACVFAGMVVQPAVGKNSTPGMLLKNFIADSLKDKGSTTIGGICTYKLAAHPELVPVFDSWSDPYGGMWTVVGWEYKNVIIMLVLQSDAEDALPSNKILTDFFQSARFPGDK